MHVAQDRDKKDDVKAWPIRILLNYTPAVSVTQSSSSGGYFDVATNSGSYPRNLKEMPSIMSMTSSPKDEHVRSQSIAAASHTWRKVREYPSLDMAYFAEALIQIFNVEG